MNNNPPLTEDSRPALIIGIDWADRKHDTQTIDGQGNGCYETIEPTRLTQQLIEQLKAYFPLALELSSGRSLSRLVL